MEPVKVLVLCHGNICRSPLVYYNMKELDKGKGHMVLRQGGFGRPKCRMPNKMREQLSFLPGIEDHRSRAVDINDFRWADRIIIMGPGNDKRLRALANKYKYLGETVSKTDFLGQWCKPKRHAVKDPNFMRKGSHELEIIITELLYGSRMYYEDKTRA